MSTPSAPPQHFMELFWLSVYHLTGYAALARFATCRVNWQGQLRSGNFILQVRFIPIPRGNGGFKMSPQPKIVIPDAEKEVGAVGTRLNLQLADSP
eukprot:3675528-Amphidinium_carterae.1